MTRSIYDGKTVSRMGSLGMGAVRQVIGGMFCMVLVWGGFAVGADERSDPTVVQVGGRTDFDCSDRLAITNAIMAITVGLDEKKLDLMLAQLEPEFCVEYRVPGTPPIKIAGREKFGRMMGKRFENLAADRVARRHVISPLYFIEQKADYARILLLVVTCSATNQDAWRPMSSAKVEFELRKRDGAWRAISQFETVDAPLDLPMSKVVPLPDDQH